MQVPLTDNASEIEQRIRQRRTIGSFHLPDDMVFPAHDGLSIVNTSQTILDLFGHDKASLNPLDAAVWNGESFGGEIDRVVIFLTDGLSYLLLRECAQKHQTLADQILNISDGRGFLPLSSISPSTTVAALTTYWTGVPAGMHGLLGTLLYLPEHGGVVNMLFSSTAVERKPVVLDPAQFMTVPSLAKRLDDLGAQSHLIIGDTLVDTSLSRIIYRDLKHYHAYRTMRDLSTTIWHQLEETLKLTRGRRCYISAYLPTIDTLGHLYGATSSGVEAEIRSQFIHLNQILDTARKSDAMRDGKTLFIITSDHGHLDIHGQIRLHPNIRAAMRTRTLSNDPRMAALHLHPQAVDAVKLALDEYHANELFWLDTREAIAAGLYGTGELHPKAQERLGDILLFAHNGLIFEDPLIAIDVKGMHTGLHEIEMLVPFMYTRF